MAPEAGRSVSPEQFQATAAAILEQLATVIVGQEETLRAVPVSYTHLDVYKRQQSRSR